MKRTLGFIFFLACAFSGLEANAQSVEEQAGITVTGEATGNLPVDFAIVTIPLANSDGDAKVALKSNDDLISAMKSKLEKIGIPAANITTHDFDIGFAGNWRSKLDAESRGFSLGSEPETRFQVKNAIYAKVEDFSKLADIFNVGNFEGSGGATVSYFSKSGDSIVNELAKQATANAMKSADALLAGAGAKRGPVVSIEHTENYGSNVENVVFDLAAAAQKPAYIPDRYTVTVVSTVKMKIGQ